MSRAEERFQSRRRDENKLTVRQRIFVHHYLRTLNARYAYACAYPNASERSAMANSSRVLNSTNVQNVINQELERMEVNQSDLLKFLVTSAFADHTQILDEQGNIRPPSEWPIEIRQTAQLELRGIGGDSPQTNIKFGDKMKVMEMLARHLNLYEKENSSKNDGLAQILGQVYEKKDGLPVEQEANRKMSGDEGL